MSQPAVDRRLCPRAREWTSLRLDDELSEFEGLLLDAHLARCPDCREFVHGAETMTEHIRRSPLEPLERLVVLPPGRRHIAPARAAAAVAACAAVVGLASGLALQARSHLEPAVSQSLSEGAWNGRAELRQLQTLRVAQLRPVALITAPKLHTRIEADTRGVAGSR